MLRVDSSEPLLTYDIHAIISSFYPGEEIKVVTPESHVHDRVLKGLTPVMRVFVDSGRTEKCGEGSGNIAVEIDPCRPEGESDVTGSHVSFTESGNVYGGGPVWHPGESKDDIKRFIYTCLSKERGMILPWGVLTGVRPVKPALSMLEKGASEREVKEKYISDYYVNQDKADLVYEIAERESKILSGLMSTYSLYVGIPFCPTTCMYCSFASYPVKAYEDMIDGCLDRVIEELRSIPELFDSNRPDTVYVGGGTPTSLSPAGMDRLLTEIDRIFDTGNLLEYTVEAGRPDTVNADILKVLKEHRVSRISINPQSMNEKTLKFIGRSHSPEDIERAFYTAREEGFDNINADIILGLPGEGLEEVAYTLEKLGMLSPESLTVHSLAVKNASRMRKWIAEHGISDTVIEEGVPELVRDRAGQMKMHPYYLYRQKHMTGNLENTGYAVDGKYGIYNVLMMEERQSIAAAGAGTVSKRVGPGSDISRSVNVKELTDYMDRYKVMIEKKRELFSALRL